MNDRDLSDRRALEEAQAWAYLWPWKEASKALESVSDRMLENPDRLYGIWTIHEHAENWTPALRVARAQTKVAPDDPLGWVHVACALGKLNRFEEAYAELLPVAKRFKRVPVADGVSGGFIIYLDLAKYACHLGKLKDARAWLRMANRTKGRMPLRMLVLNDPEMTPLWGVARRL